MDEIYQNCHQCDVRAIQSTMCLWSGKLYCDEECRDKDIKKMHPLWRPNDTEIWD